MPTSTLGYALLALLARAPSTGYELSQRAHRPLGYFWTAQHSQIHGELAKLTQAGAVTWHAAPGPGPREKKVYSITQAGRQDLAAWVVTPPPEPPVRSEMLLRVYALWTADPAAAAQMFASQLARHRERLADYEASWVVVTANGVPPQSKPDFGNYATLQYGIGLERHNIAWFEWVLGQLTTPLAQPPDPR